MAKATLMNAQVYEALIAAGAGDEKAKAAAESVVSYDNRLAAIETTLRFHSLALGALFLAVGGLYWQLYALNAQVAVILERLPAP